MPEYFHGAVVGRRCLLSELRAVSALAGWLLAWPLVAAESTPPATTELNPVQVRADRYQARRDEIGARIVVDNAELTRHGDDSLADAIKRLPGITVASGAPGSGGTIMLRGMGKGYTQILIDGQPAPADFDIGALPADSVARVEILRSASADLRSEAIAGTVNIVLARAPAAEPQRLKLALADSDGQYTPSLSWSYGDRRDGLSLNSAVNLSRRAFLVEEHGSEQGDGLLRNTALRVQGRRSALSATPSLRWELGENDRLDLNLRLDASDLNSVGDIDWDTVQGAPLRHARYRQHTARRNASLRADLGWRHAFASGAALQTTFTIEPGRTETRFTEQGYDAAGRHNLADLTTGRIDTRTLSSLGKYSFPTSATHALQVGWELSRERRWESRRQRLAGFDGAADGGSARDYDARLVRAAFYLQDEWTLTQRAALYWGGRGELLDTVSAGNDFATIRQRQRLWSPTLQARWKLGSAGHQLRLGFSRSFRAPTLAELIPRPYTSTNNRALDPDQIGNPDLRPERASGIELTLERFDDDGHGLSIGGYARRIGDVIRNVSDYVDGRWRSRPINGGRARVLGLELDGKWRPWQDADLGLNLTRNASLLRDVPGPDNRIDAQPRWSGTVSLQQRLDARWQAGVSFAYRSGDRFRSSAQRWSWQAPRRELDVYLQRRWQGGAQLRLALANLLHQDQRSGTGSAEEGDEVGLARSRRSPPTLRLEWQWTL